MWDQSVGSGYWNLNLVRSVNDWEVDSVVSLLGLFQCERFLLVGTLFHGKGLVMVFIM